MLSEFRRRVATTRLHIYPHSQRRVITSAEVSDRFPLGLPSHTGRTCWPKPLQSRHGVSASARDRTYGEAAGVSLEIPEDTLLNKKHLDIPMASSGRDLHPSSMYYEDVRGAASASHVYGKTLVATESFTGGGYESPYR